ncbi:MAG TPA: hypothetical protein DDW36_02220 [Candidatus Magasanikbacteria bacterium]|nr:hypothetical protein [Candidatus Magasanikbacteria bacterium]
MFATRLIIRSVKNYKINIVVKLLVISDFIVWSSYQLMAPIFAVFITGDIQGASIETVGIASAIYLVFKSLIEIPLGIYIDRTASEKDDLFTAMLGTIITGFGYIAYTFVDQIWHLYVLQALLGFAAALAYPGWLSIFSRHLDKRSRALEWSIYDVSNGLGMAAAAALGGFMANKFGFDIVFFIVGIFTFVGALILLMLRNKIYVPKEKFFKRLK